MPVSDKARTSAQRKARIDAGWTEVRVWVASRDDVHEIRNFAEKLRMDRIREQVRQIGRARGTTPAVVEHAICAFNLQHSPEYNTPSGATLTLTLLSDLARAKQLKDLNAVVEMFTVAHPGNARFVAESVPAKVLNHFVAQQLDFRSTDRMMKWQAAHPDWAMDVEAALGRFELENWAEATVREMQAIKLN